MPAHAASRNLRRVGGHDIGVVYAMRLRGAAATSAWRTQADAPEAR